MSDSRTVKKIFNWKHLTKRSQGRPKYRWEDNIKQDICQMKIKNWTACVQDREKWKEEVVERAKTVSNERQFSGKKKKKKKKKKIFFCHSSIHTDSPITPGPSQILAATNH
jgi:hypothetical protein